MAILEKGKNNLVEAEQRAAAQKQSAIAKYGEILGEAYLNHSREHSIDSEEQVKCNREAFAEAIVVALESDIHEDRVKGITALLSSLEEKIAPVAKQAAETSSHFTPIG